jgi:hypothetical protein
LVPSRYAAAPGLSEEKLRRSGKCAVLVLVANSHPSTLAIKNERAARNCCS